MLNQISYILLDAARLGDQINEATKQNKAHDSLYRGGPEQKLSSVAPYLFQFKHNTPFADWVMENGWGDSWGVFFHSSYGMQDVFKHFRKFIKVPMENGGQMYFRFYDPRVLRVFLPNCNAAELQEFFGPVEFFLIEDEDKQKVIRYSQANGVLKTQIIQLSDVYIPPIKSIIEDVKPIIDEVKQPEAKNTEVPAKPADLATRPKATNVKSSKWNMFD